MKIFVRLLILPFLLLAGKKDATLVQDVSTIVQPVQEEYKRYVIPGGAHFCDRSMATSVNLSTICFKVKFDSSAIYETTDPVNQFDINKLMGFTEGIDPHLNSARIGWSYNNCALRLYAYTYNNGVRSSQEICTVALNQEINCSISLSANSYNFQVNNNTATLTRASNSAVTSGYLLFPYFGGDETAPAPITIYIKGPHFF